MSTEHLYFIESHPKLKLASKKINLDGLILFSPALSKWEVCTHLSYMVFGRIGQTFFDGNQSKKHFSMEIISKIKIKYIY